MVVPLPNLGSLPLFRVGKEHFSPPFRLIWATGVSSALSTYVVGVYSNKEFLGKSAAENLSLAEEMAARDALRRLFETDEKRAGIPFDKLFKKGLLIDK